MKRILGVILVWLCVAHTTGTAQTTSATSEQKNLRYGLITEFGLYGGYANFGGTTVFVNNLVLNENLNFGLGAGMEFEILDQYSIPFFFNFRYYLPSQKGKRFQPLVNAAIGMRVCMEERYESVYYTDGGYTGFYREEYMGMRITPGIYSTLATGFRANAFSFTTGLFFKTGSEFSGGLEVKCGFTF